MSRTQAVRPWVILSLLAVMACAAPEAPATAGLTEADRSAIEQVTTEFEQGVRAGNFAAVAALYATDAVLMPPNAPAVTGPDAIQAWMASLPTISQFELTNVSVDGAGDLAYVHGTYSTEFTMPDSTKVPDTGKFMDIRRRQADGRWLLTHDIFNSDIPLPTGPAATP